MQEVKVKEVGEAAARKENSSQQNVCRTAEGKGLELPRGCSRVAKNVMCPLQFRYPLLEKCVSLTRLGERG